MRKVCPPDFHQCKIPLIHFRLVNKTSPTLYFLAGVTSCGKTQLALEWAEENGAEILSCDSIALYQGMDIGSAKPTEADQKRVKHYGLDLSKVNQRFDVSKYVIYAKKIIKDACKRNSKILVVGGSGFYLRSFFSAVVDEVTVSDEIKKYVDCLYREDGLNGLLEKLKQLNPNGLGELDQSNPVRVIKSLERCLATGLTLKELQKEFEKKPIPYSEFEKKTVLLDREDKDLIGLIKRRTEWMLANGLIEEVEGLIEFGLMQNYPASSAVGYRETLAYLRGEIKRENLAEAIQVSTRQLAAKQRKWFRKYYHHDQLLIPVHGKGVSLSELVWRSDT